MNFKSILVVGLSLATVGLSLPAHADTATVINSDQGTIVTGDGNYTSQENTTRVSNSERGRRTTGNNTGTSVNSRQSADVQGRYNDTTQVNGTEVTNSRRNVR
jgi:hypothetical protein